MSGEATPATPAAEPTPTPATPAAPAAAAPEPTPAAPAAPAAPATPATILGNEPAPAAPVAPETYTLEGTEGMAPEALEGVTAAFKAAGLSNDQAQAVMNLEGQRQETEAAARDARNEADIQAVKDHPVMGGAQFEPTKAAGREVMAWFNDPQLVKDLVESGMASRPSMVAALLKVHSEISEGTLTAGRAGGAEGVKPKTAAEAFYGTVDVVQADSEGVGG